MNQKAKVRWFFNSFWNAAGKVSGKLTTILSAIPFFCALLPSLKKHAENPPHFDIFLIKRTFNSLGRSY
ncbi:hypothetical protein [Exercitatus varius]|uniref:hypothetical protein n=1 Tax=Exercitatus varius TaxID=67857 RepID=UPI00294AA6F0|nr:hypothetical protein [Exercitatus varius]MDG2957844.1 hypothetical protein [Exercitatus varius]